MNKITMTLQVDHLILEALKEDISSEDVTTNSVMKEAVPGEVDLICKEDGIIAGLEIFSRVFTLLDADTKVELFCKDGDEVKKGQKMGKVTGDIRVLLSGERVALNYLQKKYFEVGSCSNLGDAQAAIPRIPKRIRDFKERISSLAFHSC